MQNIRIKKFSLETMINKPLILIVGKKGTGKTTLIKTILRFAYGQDLNGAVIISPIKHDYDNCFTNFIYSSTYDQQLINKKAGYAGCIVIDNALFKYTDPNIFYENDKLRIISISHYIDIPDELIDEIDYIFLLADDNYSDEKHMYEKYCNIFPTYDMFREVYQEITKDYTAMVIDRTVTGVNYDLDNKIYWYRTNE